MLPGLGGGLRPPKTNLVTSAPSVRVLDSEGPSPFPHFVCAPVTLCWARPQTWREGRERPASRHGEPLNHMT